ncbi:hypothetical protein JTF06_13260 [Desemzia sp. RIT804]|uniref:hypothetical protein n=1 Tax=Desemzia sp. RIT 804 TaxID=2810209 RepID=UPI00194E8D85|nr:hypothetical protein [Desemzia sp. RIT 804]MBM6615854.1 hypothetical protein [Desemzia sp. RIT 804]
MTIRNRSIFLFVLVGIFLLARWYLTDPIRGVSQTLGLHLSKGTILQDEDSHGGFHGDGMRYLEIAFSDTEELAIIEDIQTGKGWHALPLTDNLDIALYGGEDATTFISPYISWDNREPLFPIIENGYYFFLDRHSDSVDEEDDNDLFNRFSYNFTLAVYDSDTKMLYYCEFDT